jgi:hypothetical protein
MRTQSYLRNLPHVPEFPPEPKQRVVLMLTQMEFAKLCGMAAGAGIPVQQVIKRALFEDGGND